MPENGGANSNLMSKAPRIAVLIAAAGKGLRAGEGLSKQYRPLCGVPVVARTVDVFRAALPEAQIHIVIAAGDEALLSQALGGREVAGVTTGGVTRQDSVRRGLEALTNTAPDMVLIHDAARPFISPILIHFLAKEGGSGDFDGVAPGIPIADSIKKCAADGAVEASVSRADLWRVQTPQVFRFPAILDAHRAADPALNLSDDFAVAERAGLRLKMVQGEEANFKITTAADFDRAIAALVNPLTDIRTAQGFDVHAFSPGDHVMLCGVRIAHTHALLGHSDADVGLHAITDAVLGCVAAGDIGTYFPPSDPRWKGAASQLFLEHARDLVAARGGMIAHVDVTLICEAPKIGPHRDAMIGRVADILRLARDRVSVKATTTERLGFTGRNEGIAAMATATVRLP
ncbi:Bifunctional enzyme IspD/IspF [Alphaproteobacteria bacterium SO-S41]|nr:Bifunctional enzyme IspD/IspF [Alphaproteobacteria bacterium SO-S41]